MYKKLGCLLLVAIFVVPAISFAQTSEADEIVADTSAEVTVESLRELQITLLKKLVTLLQERLVLLMEFRGEGTVLGIATTTDATAEEEPRRRGGGGGGGSSSSDDVTDAADDELLALQQTVASLQAELERLETEQTTIEELEAQIAALEAGAVTRDEELTNYIAQVASLNQSIEALEADNAALAARILELETLNQALSATLDDRNVEVSNLQSQVDELLLRVTENQGTIDSLTATRTALQAEVETLETTVTDLGTVIATQAAQIAELEAALLAAQATSTIDAVRIGELEANLAAAQVDIVALQTELAATQAFTADRIAALEEQLAETESQLADWQQLVASQEASISDLVALINGVIAEVATLRQLVADLTEQVTELESLLNTDPPVLTGVGQLDEFILSPALDTEVKAGEEDVVIGEIELLVVNGDVEINYLDIALSTTFGGDPWQAFESVALWVDGDQVIEIPANDSNAYLDEDEGELRFANLGIIALEDEPLYIVVAASLLPVIPEDELTDWELTVTQLRYFDADGVATTENNFDDIGYGGVEFEVREPGGEELEFSLSSNNPDANFLLADENSNEEYTIFVFEIEAEEGDVELETTAVTITTPGGNTLEVVDDVAMVLDGQPFLYDTKIENSSESVTYLFEIDGDILLEEGEDIEVEVVVELEGTDGYSTPQLIEAAIDSIARDLFEATGFDDLNPATDFSGLAFGETHTIVSEGLIVEARTFQSDVATLGENDQIGEFVLEFEVTAFEQDFYFTDAASTTAISGLQFAVDGPDAPVTSAVLTSTADEVSNGVFEVQEGETEAITLTVILQPTVTGVYRVTLDRLYFSGLVDGVTDAQVWQFAPAQDFRTNFQAIQGE